MRLPPMPGRIESLPRDQRGYPIPWFVASVNGVPDFRVVDSRKTVRAIRERRCFICGEPLGRMLAFTVGPMCAINRVSAEPPSHRDCAEFSVKACPFLNNPAAGRRETNMPADATEGGGIMLRRNPGVTLIWITKSYSAVADSGGLIFTMGDPIETAWYAEGRAATRSEVEESIRTGYPSLEALANAQGGTAPAALTAARSDAERLLPEA